MSAVVEVDSKGRILLPIEVRRKMAVKRFKVTTKGESIELKPVVRVEELKGKYRDVIRTEWEDLEEKEEEFVASGRR